MYLLSSWRRFFRFSLMAFLAAITALAVCLGIIVERAHRQRAAVAAIRSAGGTVYYPRDREIQSAVMDPAEMARGSLRPAVRDWVESHLGVDFVDRPTHFNINVNFLLGKFDFESEPTDATLSYLRGLEPKNLALKSTEFTDAGLTRLCNIRSLEDFRLHAPKVTDDGLHWLKDAHELKRLNLATTGVTNATLAAIAEDRGLTDLCLAETNISDIGLQYLSELKNLRSLYLADTRISGAGLRHLEGLRALVTLTLTGTDVDDAGLATLPLLPSLTKLDLEQTKVTDAGLAALKNAPNLSDLSLLGTAVTSAGMVTIAELKELEVLNVYATDVEDAAGFAPLQNLPKLRAIIIDQSISDAELAEFKQAKPACKFLKGRRRLR